jgi:hypothetical protein
VEKTVDYYMSLPYTVELEFGRLEYRASVKNLPGCKVTVKRLRQEGEKVRLRSQNGGYENIVGLVADVKV